MIRNPKLPFIGGVIALILLIFGAVRFSQSYRKNMEKRETKESVVITAECGQQPPKELDQKEIPPMNKRAYQSAFRFSFDYPHSYGKRVEKIDPDEMKKIFTDKGLDQYLEAMTLSEGWGGGEDGGGSWIGITVWENRKQLSLIEWAKKQYAYTGFKADIACNLGTIDGDEVLAYHTEYINGERRQYLRSHEKYVIELSFTYGDGDENNYRYSDAIIASLRFN